MTASELVSPRKPGFAFEMGAMGLPEHNFYRDASERQGYGELTREVLRLWLDRKREEAAALIPDEFVIRANLLGTDEMVKDRIRAYRDGGITILRSRPPATRSPLVSTPSVGSWTSCAR